MHIFFVVPIYVGLYTQSCMLTIMRNTSHYGWIWALTRLAFVRTCSEINTPTHTQKRGVKNMMNLILRIYSSEQRQSAEKKTYWAYQYISEREIECIQKCKKKHTRCLSTSQSTRFLQQCPWGFLKLHGPRILKRKILCYILISTLGFRETGHGNRIFAQAYAGNLHAASSFSNTERLDEPEGVWRKINKYDNRQNRR